MKIEICSPENPADDYKIYVLPNNRPERNYRANVVGLFDFSEDDIENLLTPAQYKSFDRGEKYQFNVSKYHLQLIQGERSAQNRQELLMYPNS